MKLDYSRCHCKISKLKKDLRQEFDEQILRGATAPQLIETFGGLVPKLSAFDISVHKNKHMVILTIQEEQPEVPVNFVRQAERATPLSMAELKQIATENILRLSTKPNLTHIEVNQLNALMETQRKFLESPAEEKKKNTIDQATMNTAIAAWRKANPEPLISETEKWMTAHERLFRNEIWVRPSDERYPQADPVSQKRCDVPTCSICSNISKSDA